MSTQAIIVVIAIVIMLVIAAGWGRGGPRITQITRTMKRDDDKDGDHA